MSNPELPTINSVATAAVDSGAVPGILVEVRQGTEIVHRTVAGHLEDGTPLEHETVFWLASLSKPVGAVAIALLAQEGRLQLHDPVHAYIPDFAAPGRVRVLSPSSPSDGLGPPFGPAPDPLPVYAEVAAQRALTIADLLTHTGGLQSIYRWNPEFRPAGPGDVLAGHAARLGSLVRDFQAGQDWAYSNVASYDALSRIVEVVSGRPLGEFLQERIFTPLGTTTLGFGRGGTSYAQPLPEPMAGDPMLLGRDFQSTAAGLWSNAGDYLTFAALLATGRTPSGVELLTSATVQALTTNQIGRLCPGLNGRAPAPGIGFGFGGVAVVDDPQAAGEHLPAGTFGWDGVGTRRFWVAPAQGWSLFCFAPDVKVQRDLERAVTTDLT